MSAAAALFAYVVFAAWLITMDRRYWGGVSRALWIPVLWLCVVAGRPLSVWFSVGPALGSNTNLDGSPLDRAFFMGLIFCGCVTLARRRVEWQRLVASNRWVVVLFLYLAISCLWSDYPVVSFKRWIKDLGNVVMVLLVITDPSPNRALQSVLARCAYLLIPASVVLIKYFPGLGRYYDQWNGRAYYTGVTTDKNMLGMCLFVAGTWSAWTLAELWLARPPAGRTGRFLIALVLAMTAWLLFKAQSSTALACTLLAVGIIIALRVPVFQRRAADLGGYMIVGVLLFLVVQALFDARGAIAKVLGRDLTFTGRTEIWDVVLNEGTNPLIGVGFYSFWMEDRAERLSSSYHYVLNEAHNGYLEMYLNNGAIGVVLLTILMISGFNRARRMVVEGTDQGSLRLAFIVGALLYAITEAVFNRMGMLWFAVLWATMDYPTRPVHDGVGSADDRSNQDADEMVPEHSTV